MEMRCNYSIKDRFFSFLLIVTMFIFISCRDDNDDYEKVERKLNFVEYQVYCNNPIVHIDIWDGRDIPYTAIGTWKRSFVTKGYDTALTVTCEEDRKATITISLFVNGKLVQEKSGFAPVYVHYKLK